MDEVTDVTDVHHCPACGSDDVPKLIVWGPWPAHHGQSFQCRRCRHEWTESGRREAS